MKLKASGVIEPDFKIKESKKKKKEDQGGTDDGRSIDRKNGSTLSLGGGDKIQARKSKILLAA